MTDIALQRKQILLVPHQVLTAFSVAAAGAGTHGGAVYRFADLRVLTTATVMLRKTTMSAFVSSYSNVPKTNKSIVNDINIFY